MGCGNRNTEQGGCCQLWAEHLVIFQGLGLFIFKGKRRNSDQNELHRSLLWVHARWNVNENRHQLQFCLNIIARDKVLPLWVIPSRHSGESKSRSILSSLTDGARATVLQSVPLSHSPSNYPSVSLKEILMKIQNATPTPPTHTNLSVCTVSVEK